MDGEVVTLVLGETKDYDHSFFWPHVLNRASVEVTVAREGQCRY